MLSASMCPPRSPVSEYRRAAEEPAMPLHHVASSTRRSEANGTTTSSSVRRTTQALSLSPKPASSQSSEATSWR